MNTSNTKPHHLKSVGKKLLCSAALLLGLGTQEASATYFTVGTGTGSNTVSSYPTPYGNANKGQKAQYFYRASELLAAGMTAGWITNMSFNVVNDNGASVHTSLKFYLGGVFSTGPSAATQLPATTFLDPAGLSVYNYRLRWYDPVLSKVPSPGWNEFEFAEPFYWNGTDNIIIGTCFWSGVNFKNASVQFTQTGYVASHTVVEATSSTLGVAICDLKTPPTTFDKAIDSSAYHPNIRFNLITDSCSGKPEAGRAISSVSEFCIRDEDSIIVSLVDNILGNGLTFQWQKTNRLTDAWVNVGAPKTTEVALRTVQTEATYYRCIVTCIRGGQKDTSAYAYVAQSAPSKCDCQSFSADNTQEKILKVNLESIDNTTPCAVSEGRYKDFTNDVAVGVANLEPDNTYTLTARLGSCAATNNARAVKVFIDYNQDAVYDISEMIYANTYSASQPNPQNASGSFTVPVTAKKGRTAMRIVYAQAAALADVSACGGYDFGETQDYAINILPFGAPTVTGRLKVCQYDSVVMNASSVADTPVVFRWTGPGGFTGIGPKITFVDADPSLSGIYYVTATSGGRTSSARAVEVIVYPKPPIPNVLNKEMCQYEPDGKLHTDGLNVIWYNVPVGGFGDTVAPTMITYTPNEATYYLTQTVNGCVSDRGEVTIRVYLKPPPPIVVSPVTYCQLQDPSLVAKGQNLKWYLDSVGGVPSSISPIPPVGFPDTISYYVSQTINGCESDRVKMTVIVYAQPNGIILQSKKFVCQYDTASFTYFGNAPASFNYKWWAGGPGDNIDYISGGGQGPVVFRFNTPGDKVINLYVNNDNCATFKLTDTITVRAAPTADIAPILDGCVGVPVEVSMDTATPYVTNYEWDWGGGSVNYSATNGGPYGVTYMTEGIKTLKLVVTARECRSLPIYEQVRIHPLPYAKITSIRKVTNYGMDTAVINGKLCSRDTLVFTAANIPDLDYQYKWSPDFYFYDKTNDTVSDRMRVPATIKVTVTDKYGCVDDDEVFINVEPCCDMAFPNSFTPNNDFSNDRFRPIRDGRQDIITFRIANRWGNVVFESSSTDGDGWDGTFAGRPLDMGVYNYYIKYRCLDGVIYEQKGDVTLIR